VITPDFQLLNLVYLNPSSQDHRRD